MPQHTPAIGFRPIREFDDEEDSIGEPSEHSGTVVLRGTQETKVHLFHISILEHVCQMVMNDQMKGEQLFKNICREISNANMMDPLHAVDEMQGLRNQYRLAFSKIMKEQITIINSNHVGSQACPQNTCQRLDVIMQPRLFGSYPSHSVIGDMVSVFRYTKEFKEICQLGKGAFGSVCKVEHKLDGALYAVKKVPFKGFCLETVHKVLREVRLLAKLTHPHIVRYFTSWLEPLILLTHNNSLPLRQISYPSESSSEYDGLMEDGSAASGTHTGFEHRGTNAEMPVWCLHIQMELCAHTLSDWLEQRNHQLEPGMDAYSVVDEAENERIMMQLLQALAFIHSNDIIHRDIKPKNIFMTHASEGGFDVKLGDFGLTRTSKAQPTTPLTPHPGFRWPQQKKTKEILSSSSSSSSPQQQQKQKTKEIRSSSLSSLSRSPKTWEIGRKNTRLNRKNNSDNNSATNNNVEQLDIEKNYDTGKRDGIDTRSGIDDTQPKIPPRKSKSHNVIMADFHSSSSSNRSDTDSEDEKGDDDDVDNGIDDVHNDDDDEDLIIFEDSSASDQHSNSKSHSKEHESDCDGPRVSFTDFTSDHEGETSPVYTTGVGTTSYAAPEQLNSVNYNHKADMYSLGVVLYELYQPFTTGSERARHIHRLRAGDIDDTFQQRWPVVASLILELVAVDPNLRPSANSVQERKSFLTKQQRIQQLTAENTCQASVNASLHGKVNELKKQVTEKDELLREKDKLLEDKELEIAKLLELLKLTSNGEC